MVYVHTPPKLTSLQFLLNSDQCNNNYYNYVHMPNYNMQAMIMTTLTMFFTDPDQCESKYDKYEDQYDKSYHSERDNHHYFIYVGITCLCVHAKNFNTCACTQNSISYHCMLVDYCKSLSGIARLYLCRLTVMITFRTILSRHHRSKLN